MATIPKHIQIARTYLGEHEILGPLDNKRIMALYSMAGHPEVKHDETPWCAAFVAGILSQAGIMNEVPSAMRLWAPSYAKIGSALKVPVYGCIAVKLRHGGGHVGFVVAANATRVWLLAGNQGDACSVASYPRSDFLAANGGAFRLPTGIKLADLPQLPTSGQGVFNPSQA